MPLDVHTALRLQSISWQFFPMGPWFPLLNGGVSLGEEEGEKNPTTFSHLFFSLSKLIALVLTKGNKGKMVKSDNHSCRLCPKASPVCGSFVFAEWMLHSHRNGVPGMEGACCLCGCPLLRLPAGAGAEPTGNLRLCRPESDFRWGAVSPHGGSHGSARTLRGSGTSACQTFPAIHVIPQS